LRKLSSISSSDDDGGLNSPKVLGRNVFLSKTESKKRRSSNESINLSETIKNAEALVNNLDDSYSKVPEVSEENGDEKNKELQKARETIGNNNNSDQKIIPELEKNAVQYPENEYLPTIQIPVSYVGNMQNYIYPHIDSYGYYSGFPNGMSPYVQYSPYMYYVTPQIIESSPISPYYQNPQIQTTKTAENITENIDKLLLDIEKSLNDQTSCRLIQKKLEEDTTPGLANKLFIKLLPKINEYMNLPFGNYLCQKLFELISAEELLMVIQKVEGKTVDISNNLHGTRSIQKLLECSVKHENLIQEICKIFYSNITELVTVFFCKRNDAKRI